MRNPAILAKLRQAREEKLSGEMTGLAFSAIKRLLTDETTPPATVFQAGRWVLEANGFGLAAQTARAKLVDVADKALAEMTAEELEGFVTRTDVFISAQITSQRTVSAPSIECEEVKALSLSDSGE